MVAVTPDRRRAFTANIGSGTVSVLDLAGGAQARATSRSAAQPEGIALTPDGRTLWVGDLQGARVQAFDAATLRAARPRCAPAPVPIRVRGEPGRALDRHLQHRRRQPHRHRRAHARGRARRSRSAARRRRGQVTILFSADGAPALRRRDRAQPGRRGRFRRAAGCCAGCRPGRRATGWRSRPDPGRRAPRSAPHHG